MALVPMETALQRLLEDVGPLAGESVPLKDAYDRVLAESIVALRTQPPFDASAMDGYAMRGADAQTTDGELAVIGEVAAGSTFSGSVEAGQCVRIFTGAPLPAGTDTVVIQENVDRPQMASFACSSRPLPVAMCGAPVWISRLATFSSRKAI